MAYRKLDVLLNPEICNALKFLMKHRASVGIKSGNVYLFPANKIGNKPRFPWPAIKRFAQKYELKNPDAIRSTPLR